MLVTLNEVLLPAQKHKYAIGAFNVYNLETAQAVVKAAENEKSPVIINTSEKAIEYAGLENLAGLLVEMAERASVPVVVHLDHGSDLKIVKQCITAGYSSVMLDASAYKENEKIPLTKELVKTAHKNGVSVEGERDGLAGKEDNVEGKEGLYTNPDTAAIFVQETDIDAFAVSIGNAHGKPLPDEELNFKLLEEIRNKVDIPLVLHGASGTPMDQIETAIHHGVCKINIDTDLRLAFMASVNETLGKQPDLEDPRKLLIEARKAVMQVVEIKIRLFGSSGRA
jgi:fructose-bisphosphate aldolase class II